MKEIAAVFVFFTRLPFWRLKAFNVPTECYKQVVNYWPVAGWLTASVMAGVLWMSAQILPMPIAVILSIVSRLLVTGGLHEDGLADFFDGFGGGNTKNHTLEIMKDSHIGTYGVLGLIIYFLLLYNLLCALPLPFVCLVILSADPLCKLIGSLITLFLTYARTAETSKTKVVYNKISVKPFLVSAFFGLLPVVFLLNVRYWLAVIFPLIIFVILISLMKKKIQGYTGDCCGALFLLCEVSFYLGIVILMNAIKL
ncbi:adenosylcobinamide-GDP ribazoletransferase [Dysgonomonas sp.]